MELPQLFGSDYVLPAIIVVVLLIAIVGLIALRRRQQERDNKGAGGKASKAGRTAARAEKSGRASRKAAATAARAAGEAASTATATAGAPAIAAPSGLVGDLFGSEGPAGGEGAPAGQAATAQASDTAPPPPPQVTPPPADRKGAKISEAGAALAADPLQAVLNSLLAGWGDLTAEDTNRLGVFRRDRVLAAIHSLEIPKETKGEYAKTRLTQLRRYAAHLEQEQQAAPREVEVHEFAGIAFSGAAGAEPGAAAGAGGSVAAAPAEAATIAGVAAAAGAVEATAGAAPPVGAATTPAAGTIQHSPRVQTKSWYALEAEEPPVETAKPAPEPRDWTSSPTGRTEEIVVEEEEEEESAGRERAAEFDWGSSDEHIRIPDIKAVDLTWNQGHAAGAEPAEAEPLTTPAQPAKTGGLVADYATEPRWPAGDEAGRTAEAAVSAAAAAFWDAPEASQMEKAAGMLGRTVSNAADIMALPEDERVEMLAFLEPHELVKVMQSTQDRTLKKGVIDTLTNINNTAALNAIQTTLDDPDPEVQLYALDAAERLLGNNS